MGAHKIRAAISGFNKPECKGDIKFLSVHRRTSFILFAELLQLLCFYSTLSASNYCVYFNPASAAGNRKPII